MKLKHLDSFRLFQKAYNTTRHEIAVSLVALFFVTIIFTLLMWIAEQSANSDYSLVDALVWTVVKYVDDPADVVFAPQTIFGQVIGTLVGILGIAIFAVPAGLIGSGLMSAIEEDKEEEKIEKNSALLHKQFRRISQVSSWYLDKNDMKVPYKCVPRYHSMDHIRVKMGLTEDEIIAAVNKCPDMRLMNLASTQREDVNPQDRVVVVNFPLNNEYGCYIDRGSDVTIVAPIAISEIGTGSFAFSLAAMGGFNYVSKELAPNPDDPFGFYTMQKSKLKLIGDYDAKEDVESQALHFMYDLNTLKQNSKSRGSRHWFIFIMGTKRSEECQMHLWRVASDLKAKLPRITINGQEYGSTILTEDEQCLQGIVESIKKTIGKRSVKVNGTEQCTVVDIDNNNLLKSVGRSNIMCRMGGGVDCNALTIRIGYEILIYNSSHLLFAKDLADTLKSHIEPEHIISEEAKQCFMNVGDGYADKYGETIHFDSNPNRLEAMIKQKSHLARNMFEHLDLDGNEENTHGKK